MESHHCFLALCVTVRKAGLNPEACSFLGGINMALNNALRAGGHRTTFAEHVPRSFKASGGRKSFPRKKGTGEWRRQSAQGGFPDSRHCMLVRAHRAPATNSRICHCHFRSGWHCSGNCMYKAELPAPSADRGVAL